MPRHMSIVILFLFDTYPSTVTSTSSLPTSSSLNRLVSPNLLAAAAVDATVAAVGVVVPLPTRFRQALPSVH